MRNLGFIILVSGFLALALVAPSLHGLSAAAATAVQSATLAARPVPSPNVGGRPALPRTAAAGTAAPGSAAR